MKWNCGWHKNRWIKHWANALALTIEMNTGGGKKLFKKHCEQHDWQQLKMIYIATFLWKMATQQQHTQQGRYKCNRLKALKKLMLKYYPRERFCEKRNHWKIQKFHALLKCSWCMKMFGSGVNFNGGLSEHNLQKIVQHLAQSTQQRATNFTFR